MTSRVFNRVSRVAIAPMLVASLFLTSCVSTAIDPANMSPAEIALRQQQTEDIRIVQGVATGAIVGAAGGALLAAVTGGDSRAVTRGAIIGGMVGGVAGGVDANNVNRGARSQSSQQAQYRATIESANKAIAFYRRSNSTASSLVSSENSRVSRLNADFQAGRIDRASYRRQLANAGGNVAILDSRIGRAERDISALRSSGAPASSQIAALQAEKRRLQNQRDALKKAYSRVPDEINLAV